MGDNFPTARAAAKHIRLINEHEMESEAVSATFDSLSAEYSARRAVERDYQNSRARAAQAGQKWQGSDRELSLKATLARHDERIGLARKRHETAVARRTLNYGFAPALDEFVRDARRRGSSFRDIEARAPKIGDGEKQVAAERRQIAALKAAISATIDAPATSAELLADFTSELDKLVIAGVPTVIRTSRSGDPTAVIRLLRGLAVAPEAMNIPGAAADQFGHLLAWLFRDEIVAKVKALIGDTDPPGALSYDQRETAIAKLSDDLLAAERREEALIDAAEAQGITIPRRADADPRAILGIEEA